VWVVCAAYAQVEGMMGGDIGLVSRLLAFTDEAQLATALRGSFLNGSVQPRKFLDMLDMVLADLEERLPSPLEAGAKAQELRDMHAKLRNIYSFTEDFIASTRL
jgi:hypothetical protein